MNFNHSWNGSRGRNRGNRGPGRNWRGGHYRGGSHFHRVGPPMLNSDNYYSPNRFRGHDNFPNYYAHSPVNQNEHWTPRNRLPPLSNPRQSFLPNMHFSQQNPTRSLSPLPGSEEYMERNISEKSALLKRELELEGSGFLIDNNMKQIESVNSDSTNNNFFENTYPKECNDEQSSLSVNEVTESPRRGSKKQRPISQSVEEIHRKIINHISNLSYSKKMNLVNLSGPSGYDIAIQEVTRQKRMELSKVLRDMCHNKFKENDDSSQVINAIIPDFDIKIEELPREVVEQLSSTLHEDVTERVSLCIDPELMFQQAAEMLNITLDSDKSVEDGDDKVDFSCVNFSNNDQICDVPIANNIEKKEPTIGSMINESVSTPNVQNVESCPTPTCTVDFTIPPQVVTKPQPSSLETEYPILQEPVEVNSIKPDEELYSPGHESSNCSSLEPCNTNYDVMNIPEPADIPIPSPADIPIPPSTDIRIPPTDTNENQAVDSLNAEDAQNESDVLDLNNRDKISFNLNKRTLLKNEDFAENGSVRDDEEKSQVSITESHNEEKVEETPKVTENESGKEDKVQTVKKQKDRSKNKETKSKEIKDEKKIEKEESPPKKIRKDRKNKNKTKEEDEESEKKKQERKSKSRHEGEDAQRTLEKDDRSERRQRDKYNVAETSRAPYDDDVVERRKDKKVKNKYDGEYYSSKYERGKFEVYQGQGYDEGYRKRYRESPAVDDDKHRRSDHDKGFERYRELEADIYHYSKYPVEIEDGRNSKRYYHEKSSYRQEYEYPYNKYDYSSSEYYQRSEVYPSEEYDQKVHYSKAHKGKYKRHNKKHKRHRDRSSDSNASSSGSEKNSSTSSFMVNKHTSKQSDLYESSEEGVANRLPKTSLMERLQVLCDTKLGGIKLEPVSPNPNEDVHKRDSVHSEVDKSINKDINELPKDVNLNEQTIPVDTQPSERSGETTVTERDNDNAYNAVIDSVSPITIDTKHRSESEDDLKNSSEVENFECKNYRQRPWKSPGEKKFMMEHLNQNPTNEDGVEIDMECTHEPPLTEGLIASDPTSAVENVESQPSEISELQANATLSGTVVCGAKSQKLDDTLLQVDSVVSTVTSIENEVVMSVGPTEELKIVEKMLVTTYTQTISDNLEESAKVDKEEEEKKEVTTAFTQTTLANSTTSTQTEMAKMSDTAKQIQTDHVIIVDHLAETAQMDGSIPKPLRCKQFIERMYEIDKEIERLVKLRQSFYHLFLNVSDSDLVVSESKETKGTASSSKSVPKQFESKGSRHTPTPSISERSNSKKRNPHTTGDHKTARSSEHGSRSSHHKHDVTDSKTSTPEPSKQKSAQSHRERSRKTDPKPVNIADKQKSSKLVETQKIEKRESEGLNKNNTPISDSAAKVQHHGRGRPRKHPPNTSQTSKKMKPSKEERAQSEEKKPKVTNLKERSDTSRKRKLKKDETPDKDVKRPKKSDPIEVSTVEKEKVVEVVPVAIEPEKEANDDKDTKPEDVVEDCKPVEVAVTEAPPQEEKNVTVVDESESLPEPDQKLDVENKLNGSFVGDAPEEKEEFKVDPVVVDNPATPVTEESIPTLTSSESSTPSPKKKKRRLSGMMAEYRKKKKKSKKSKKRDEKSAEPKCVSVESSVKITRFSLEQLENMRESIRGKQLAEEEDSPICNDQDTKSKEIEEVNETVETGEENVSVPEPVLQGESESISYSIDFKNFTGAILVIKVIENTVLAASDKGQLCCFDILNGELLNTVDISNLAVTSLVVTSNNDISTVYVGSLDARLTIFNFQTKEIVKQESVSEPIQCMEYSWNFVFVGSDRGTLLRFDLDTETVVDQTKISSFNILMIKASLEGPRKILVVATRNSPVSIRDALSGLLLRTMESSFSPTVYTLLIDRSMVYCGTSQHGILVYTFEDGQLALQHEATKSKGVVCMQIVSNLLFAGCYNGNIYVYNTKTNAYLGTMNGPGGLMLSMEIVNDRIIVGTKSSNFKAWKIPQEYYEEK
ncbi:hypothetical protein RI129_003891 [Pyrocoelia pectoralis]|uniref:Zinc finger protein 106 n=1 Tax=Pyrocoelia pectoralis TaxID=417401 RepID=A0AAN7VQE0_9COLE